MGTDIHAFIEIDLSKGETPFENEGQMYAFNFGELLISRNHELFNALGDGRSYNFDEKDIEKHCLYPPRGLPKYYSVAVENRYFHIVDERDRKTELQPELDPSLSIINSDRADKLLREGLSCLGNEQEIWRDNKKQKLRRVSHPYWHSCSWLTLREIHQSLEHFELEIGELDFTFRTVINLMTNLEQELGIGRTRLLFWFDN